MPDLREADQRAESDRLVDFQYLPDWKRALVHRVDADPAVIWKPVLGQIGSEAWQKGPIERADAKQRISPSRQYRADIDGLRAVAVIAVLLYHAGIAPFTGGYVGVDVFFVISGYLITSIILEDVGKGRFSILSFYERRVRRIFPALFAVLFVCFLIGSLLLMPADFRRLGATTAAVGLSASNFLLARQTGYFDTGAEVNPLLHTWSLAVEEQFYLVFPLLAAAMFLVGARAFLIALVTLSIFSLGWSVLHLTLDPSGAFYLPGGRAWELLLGAMIVAGSQTVAPARWPAEVLGIMGAAMILWSVLAYSANTPFPGAYALVPCLGAALIIYSGVRYRTMVARLLSVRVIVFVGVISYSLYLWHWPMIGLTKYYLMRDMTVPEALLVLLASGVVACLSWRYIELPFRRRGAFRNMRTRALFASAAAVMAVSIVAGSLAYVSNGWPQRLPDDVSRLAMGALDTAARNSSCNTIAPDKIAAGHVCEVGAQVTQAAPSFAVFGDSIGTSLLPAVESVAAEHGKKGVDLTRGGCYPLAGISQRNSPPEHRRSCMAFVNAGLDYIRARPAITSVIVVGRWSSAAEGTRFGANMLADWFIRDDESPSADYAENKRVFVRGMARIVDALAGRKVFVVTSVPEQKVDVPRIAALARYLGRVVQLDVDREEFDNRQRFVASALMDLSERFGFTILDLGRSLCTASSCAATRGDVSLYSDDNHLSRYGALSIKHIFEPVFTPK